ncbi:MAG: bifunctional UDP-3-O-[3-hydroxymyristoyl] N-acetylglucosamine deacetylase/3-hydroxyacyl-ACP dehydratase [Bacteroidota bacterium]
MIRQKTISKPVSIAGKGLHTGEEVILTFVPAPQNHGYVFKRIDLENQPLVHARLENVVETSRGTTIEENGVRVCTIEHILAATAGLEIDNILIELNSSETPILDGSSIRFVEALLSAGIVEQDSPKKFIELKSNFEYFDAERNVEMIAIPSDKLRITTMIDYKTNVLGTQFALLDDISLFKNEIANCRTFVFLHELESLLENNLIKGGDLNNAIVFVNRIISQPELDHLAVVFNKPKVNVLKEGILNNLELNFPNEPARHKLLDIVGDLALLGGTLKAHIFAKRPGHYSNITFARRIAELVDNKNKNNKKGLTETFDLTKPPLYDINQIKKILPHRPPFLLIDKILEMDEKGIVGLKNVTMNESFFVGHFPDEPLMPGVLQIEAMAQCGGIFALKTVPDPENYLTLFLKIESARFKHKVVPGDTLIFKIVLTAPIRRGICQMTGTAYVNSQVVMEAELLAQIVKKDKK